MNQEEADQDVADEAGEGGTSTTRPRRAAPGDTIQVTKVS